MADGELEFKARTPDATTMALAALTPVAIMTTGVALIFPHRLDVMQSPQFWRHLLLDPRTYFLLVAVPWFVMWMWLRSKYERLYLGPTALRYTSPYAGKLRLLSFLQPAWTVEWAGLKKAELQVQSLGFGKRRYLLVFQGVSGRRVLEWPLSWQRVPSMPGTGAAPRRRDETEMRRVIMNSPLVQALRNRGVQVSEVPGLTRAKSATKGYDISQDKGLMIAVGALVVLLVYFLGDTFIVWPYMALQNVPVWPYAIAGAVGLWIGLQLGKKAPSVERTLISIMLAGALCGACYPAMLRLDAMTAGTADQVYGYTQVRSGYFKPPEAELPYIYFDNEPAYWNSFRNGSTHGFRVVKGALDFYEVDTGRVQDEVRAWWAIQKFR